MRKNWCSANSSVLVIGDDLLQTAIFGSPLLFRRLFSVKELRGVQDLLRAGANPVVFGEVDPPNGSRGVHEELCGACYVATIFSGMCMNHIVAFDSRCIGVGENGEGVSGLLNEIA